MGSYPVWRKAADRNDLKRLTFVCGPETVLVEEVVAETKMALGVVDYLSFNMSVDNPNDFFNALFQYPLDDKSRLIVLRDTHKVEDWKAFYEWLEDGFLSMPKTNVLMVSPVSYLHLKDQDGNKSVREPAQAFGHRGRLVECKSLKGDELIKWALRFSPELDEQLVKYLAARVGGDLAMVRTATMKLDLFKDQYLSKEAVDQVVEESVGDKFIDLLVRGEKYKAILAIPAIKMSDYPRLFNSCDHMLDVLAILNSELRRFLTKREQQQIIGVSPWHAEVYGDTSRSYDRFKVQRCRSALAYLEDAYSSGDDHILDVEDGVLEALVTLWH